MKPMGLVHFGIAALAFWLGIFMFPKGADRGPASVKSEIWDYSGLSTEEFEEKTRIRLAEGLSLIKGTETIRIQLGHVYGPDRSISMCETYPNIIIELTAEGMAIHGHPPTIVLSAPCSAPKASQFVDEIVFPYKQLLNETPEDGEFEFNNTKIVVKHLDGEWPFQYYVNSITLAGRSSLAVSLGDLRRINRQTTTISW